MLEQISQRCISYFLCKFDPKSKKRKTKDVIREVALEFYSRERVEEFIDQRLTQFQGLLVSEFNSRYSSGSPLRYQIADSTGSGSVVQGLDRSHLPREIKFQDSLHGLEPNEFEKVAAILLRILGCEDVYFTPASHDQGVDAFGLKQLVSETPYGTTHQLTWIAQAKHYMSSQVSTGNVRELVGSRELLLSRIFSTVDERYKELTLRRYAPTAVALITTEEIPLTVRRLAEGAGVFVFAASDLLHFLRPSLGQNSLRGIRALIRREEKSIQTLS